MTTNGVKYDFHLETGPRVRVEHIGPDGGICGDGWVYVDRVVGGLPVEVVKVAREILCQTA